MIRRLFIQTMSSGLFGLSAGSLMPYYKGGEFGGELYPSQVTIDKNQIQYHSKFVTKPFKVILVADTHLWMNDERGTPYRQYSDRMAQAYNQTIHFRTGENTNPKESFVRTLDLAIESEVDLLILLGDIFSWPSEAAIEWAYAMLNKTKIPYIYIAGNHDWHYEGMNGTLAELRETWINNRLLPLYQGKDPMMAVYDVKGIRFLAIDNSTYEISNKQLIFFKDQVKSNMPLILLMHIPMYIPGKSIFFGCGHPDWGAKTDPYYEIERRPKWPESGHTKTTLNFYREVFTAPNLLGIFSGHIHSSSIGYVNGVLQVVADDNASGAFLDISFNPLPKDNILY